MTLAFSTDLAPIGPSDANGVRCIGSQEYVRRPLALIRGEGYTRPSPVDDDGTVKEPVRPDETLVGVLPPIYPEWLGDATFLSAHGCRFPLVVGEMARGIATPEMVAAAANAGLMAFYGSAGLSAGEVEQGLQDIARRLGEGRRNWGANLIHSPQDQGAEWAFAELALRHGLEAVSASAFMRLTPVVVFLSAKGLRLGQDGQILRARRIFAKVSRPEVARQFLSPAPRSMLAQLVEAGRITEEEAALAQRLPVAQSITVEADSGGHTDNRPLTVLLPLIQSLAAELAAEFAFAHPAHVGVAGGIGSPAGLAAAFSAGADYVVTGSINQSAIESGLSENARELLASAGVADVAMAPAADMFELGVKVQVLKRGTFFAQRAQRLYDTYRKYDGLDQIPAAERADLEKNVLGATIEDVWMQTCAHFKKVQPEEIDKAEKKPKHKMALVFRWYLFMGAEWARQGVAARRGDYQIWCGPAMGAFNDWVRGSYLEPLAQREVVQISLNLLEGATHVMRAQQLRLAGVAVSDEAFIYRPRRLL